MQNNIIKMPRKTRPTETATNVHRNTVMDLIASELYPPDHFPPEHFPDLHTILFSAFVDSIKSRKELWNIYRSGINPGRVKEMVREILNFRALLSKQPQIVVLIYQRYIFKFITYKHRNTAEREDIFQEVLTRLFEVKIKKIQEKYDFDFHGQQLENLKKISSFTSYLMVTVRNIYIDIIRERNVRPLTSGGVREIEDVDAVDKQGGKIMLNRLMIQEELLKLKTILLMYYKARAKLELCLKLKYRLPITREDVEKCFPRCTEAEVDTLMQDFTFTRDKQLYRIILAVFNQHEGRKSKSDSLRKWINVKVDEIVLHLNRTHNCSVYNSKNFADFIALYYQNIKGDQAEIPETPRG